MGNRKTYIPNHLLQLTIWTCHKSHMWKYAKGTCGQKYIPVYQPNTAYAQADRHEARLPRSRSERPVRWLLDRKQIWRWSISDQAAVMSGTDHLWLNVRGDALDCGMPSTRKDDYKGNAPVFTWYYPDKNG